MIVNHPINIELTSNHFTVRVINLKNLNVIYRGILKVKLTSRTEKSTLKERKYQNLKKEKKVQLSIRP